MALRCQYGSAVKQREKNKSKPSKIGKIFGVWRVIGSLRGMDMMLNEAFLGVII